MQKTALPETFFPKNVRFAAHSIGDFGIAKVVAKGFLQECSNPLFSITNLLKTVFQTNDFCNKSVVWNFE
ncbi:MAG: hypothetical protein A2252_11890 [Elusimicrobia bacterium RIFOXYA2_FULL_39_19]|nr:MAG: hypothetical protein A2252_11890 [Elusimicrobia bacterium RIFOXYA2_FULL_39_19]